MITLINLFPKASYDQSVTSESGGTCNELDENDFKMDLSSSFNQTLNGTHSM
jgi:hypothetical protein